MRHILTHTVLLLLMGCSEEESQTDCVGQECSELACGGRSEETCEQYQGCRAYYGQYGCEAERVFVTCGAGQGCNQGRASGISPEGECYRFPNYCIPWGWELVEDQDHCCPSD